MRTLATETIPLVVRIDGTGCSHSMVGGKAAGLDRLAAHGFPIPVTFALSAQAYREAIDQGDLLPWLEALAERPVPDPSLLASEEAEITDRFAQLRLPPRVRDAILATAEALLDTGEVSVRSSATAEDLGTASFAGQYRSFLHLKSPDQVLAAVRSCWASLWFPTAREYRSRHGIDQSDLAMAVVIQAMVAAEWSGVGFTRDPSSHPDLMRIEVVPGVGDALVSGSVTPLDFIVHRDSLEVSSKHGEDTPAFLENLARMLLRVEDEFDGPQDVEWSWAPDGLVLLQARPETVSGPMAVFDDGFDMPIDSKDTFTPQGVIEMLPGVMSPLLWSINAPMIEDAFRSIVGQLGGTNLDIRRPYVGRFRGRAALNLSALREIASDIPGGSAADVEQQFLGRAISPTAERAVRRPHFLALLRARNTRQRLGDEVALAGRSADMLVDLDIDLAVLPARRLLAYGCAVRDLAWRITGAEVASSSAAAASYRSLELLLERWLGPGEAATWAQRLTTGTLTDDLAGSRLDLLLRRIWETEVVDHPGLDLLVRLEPVEQMTGALGQLGIDGDRLLGSVRRATRLAGCKAVYGGSSWAGDMEGAWSRLSQIAGSGEQARPSPRETWDLLVSELTAIRRWRLIRILTGQLVDLRLRWIDRQTHETISWLRRREQAKSALLTLGGEERRIIEECARRLVASSHLDDPKDIELYSDEEVRAMTLHGATVPAPVVHWRRKARRRCESTAPLPEMFVGAPDREPIPEVDLSAAIHGWPASPGWVAGPARVVHDIAAADALRKGEILVTEATDPSWTTVMAQAAGIVLETGGPLSHGAIVARELGIPAVLCATRASSVIATGDWIEIDGYAGIIHRRGEGDEAA